MHKIFSFILTAALIFIGCNQEKNVDLPGKRLTQVTQKMSCSDTILPLGLRYSMSLPQIDSLIQQPLESMPGSSMDQYKFNFNGKNFSVFLYEGRLVYLSALYPSGSTYEFDKAFNILRGTVGLYVFHSDPGGREYGTICDDMMVRVRYTGEKGGIYYLSIPDPHLSYPSDYLQHFQDAGFGAKIKSAYMNANPSGFFRSYPRDY